MTLSLSVRIVEEFASKKKASMPLCELADLAVSAGYEGLCMRGSQVGVHSTPAQVDAASRAVRSRGLKVTMVTGDFDIVYNNEKGPECLRHIEPYLDLAEALGSRLIRIAIKKREDIPFAIVAADAAAVRGLRLAHQCHVESLFETVAGIEWALRQIDHPNFGLIFEPANLELCGQDYGAETIKRLAPWIFNVYLQNQTIRSDGQLTLNTWCRGTVSFNLTSVGGVGGIDFEGVLMGLAAVGYDGPVTVHQSGIPGVAPAASASSASRFLNEARSKIESK